MQINVIDYLEFTGIQSAHKVAVVEGGRSIDFGSLISQAKAVATGILNHANYFNQPIAVFLPKSIESVIANTAITYSGNIYMNVDIKYPEQRLKNVFEKIKPVIVITNTQLAPNIKKLFGKDLHIINIDDQLEAISNEQNTDLLKRLDKLIDTDPYCIINTSGSTGTPKGVALNHKSFIDFTEWAIDTLKITNDQVIGSLSPLYFDIYSFELCLLMVKSATIVIMSEQLAIFPPKLIELLQSQKINFIFWVPTIMVNIANLDLFSTYKLPDLKKILFAGEVFPTKHMNYWRTNIPRATFINLYGPIEITLDCTYYIVNDDLPNDQPVPIGYACRNTDVLILSDEDAPVADNEKGELCIRGTSLALGYWNDPEKTAKAFVQNPLNKNYPELIYRTGDVVYRSPSGEINFVGRKDFQVKHMGYRIDLSEIEHVIVNNLENIPNACVVYNHNTKDICLFYEGEKEIVQSDFRKNLIAYLPKYMVPSKFFLHDKLPRNPNGKIDRNYLKELLNN